MWALLSGTLARWVIGGLLAVVLAGGAWLGLRTYYYQRGYAAALAAVAAKDAKAVEAAQKAQKKVNECFDGGGTWNTESDIWGNAIGCVHE